MLGCVVVSHIITLYRKKKIIIIIIIIPLAVETFGHWGKEAQIVFSRLASLLSIHQGCPKSVALFDIYSRMNMCLVRSVSRAIMGRVVVL